MAEKKTIELEIKSNLDSAEKSVSSLKSQLRQAQAEVASLSDKFGATSKEAVNAAQKAAELADRIGDAKALTDAFNPDAKFRALSGALTGVAGGFSAVTGVMGALGSESKDVEQAILKVQSAMAISSGLQAVGESVDQFKILATVIKNTSIAQKALTIYQTAYNYVNAATTVGLKLLRGALISTGFGALVVVIGILIANFDKVKATILKVIPALNNIGDSVMNVVNAVTDFIGATSEAERAVDRLSAAASKSLKNNEQYLKEHGSQLDEYTKQKIAAKNEYYKLVEEDGENQKAYALELNRKLKKIDEDRAASKKEKRVKEVKTVKESNKEISEDLLKELEDQQTYEEEAQARKEEREKTAADKQKAIDDKILAGKKEQADKELAIENETLRAKEVIANANFDLVNKGVNLLAGLAGKNKALQKAAIIAQAGIGIFSVIKDTQAANVAAIAPPPIGLGPILGVGLQTRNTIGGALSIASITAASAKALSAVGSGGSVGSNSVGSNSPSFNVVGTSATNQLAQTIGQKEQQPLKAYVVAGDITTAQSLEKNIIQAASIG